MNSSSVVSNFKQMENVFRLLSLLNLTAYEWPKQACVKDGSEFDFIVVGGGTAGCLLASRLAETGKASVLLIEAGSYPPLESDMAGLFPYLKDSEHDWNFTSTKAGISEEYHTGNVIHMSQGKMLGGSGSLGFGCYGRGYPHDFNNWAAVTNDPNWSYQSVLPAFQKIEKLIDERILKVKNYYGTKGRIEITKEYYIRNRPYFNALEEMGYKYHLDINPDHPTGFTNLMFNIGDELRQTTAQKYLRPLKHNKKLHLLINTLVTKIIFNDTKTAVGVEILMENNERITVRARKEIIVTAGTIKSPHLLMLSGIGPKAELEAKNIKVISDLPVGKNFQDHVNSMLVYKMTKSSHAHSLGDPNRYPFVVFVGYPALNKSQCYPDYQTINAHFGDSATFLAICAFFFSFDDTFCDSFSDGADDKEIFLTFITYLNPESRGEILLNSADPQDYPLIIPGYYSNTIDIEKHATYLADFDRIVNTTYFKAIDGEFVDPKLKACDGIERGTMEYWKCHAVETSDTSHYFVGTCAMGTVLDSKLRVHGVKRLRVCDASSMPNNVRDFTQASVMMIAYKAADIIIEEYNLN